MTIETFLLFGSKQLRIADFRALDTKQVARLNHVDILRQARAELSTVGKQIPDGVLMLDNTGAILAADSGAVILASNGGALGSNLPSLTGLTEGSMQRVTLLNEIPVDICRLNIQGHDCLGIWHGTPLHTYVSASDIARVSRMLQQTTLLTEFSLTVGQEAARLFPGAKGFLAIFNDQSGILQTIATWPWSEPAIVHMVFQPYDNLALRTGHTVTIDANDAHYEKALADMTLPVTCVPIYIESKLICLVGSTASEEDLAPFAEVVGSSVARFLT